MFVFIGVLVSALLARINKRLESKSAEMSIALYFLGWFGVIDIFMFWLFLSDPCSCFSKTFHNRAFSGSVMTQILEIDDCVHRLQLCFFKCFLKLLLSNDSKLHWLYL